jgi:hypothetical protein
MVTEVKTRVGQDSFLEALRSEFGAGSEVLTSWIAHLQDKGGVDSLFEFEAWLRGLCAFSNCRNLPLSGEERATLVTRNFAPEIRIFRLALEECERCAIQLCRLGQDADLEADAQMETRIYQTGSLDSSVNRMLEQSTPMESLAEMLESANDLKVVLDAINDPRELDFEIFLSLGRTLQRSVRNCRYIDLLLGQRFRLQFDRIENASLSAVLRSIAEDHLRRKVSLSLLYCYRLLKYLKLISTALNEDRPLRRYLVIFALLREQSELLCDFIKSRFLKERQGNAKLHKAAELILHSLKLETQRTFERELLGLATESDAAIIYAKIENGHGLLRNCYQSCIVTLVQALDPGVDGRALFPSMMEGFQQGQALRKDLWDLRQDLKSELEKTAGLDLTRILDHLAQFRESSLRYLMYQDWGEFENFAELLMAAGNEMEVRVLLRKFVSFLEVLMQEVSKRSVLRETPPSSNCKSSHE